VDVQGSTVRDEWLSIRPRPILYCIAIAMHYRPIRLHYVVVIIKRI